MIVNFLTDTDDCTVHLSIVNLLLIKLAVFLQPRNQLQISEAAKRERELRDYDLIPASVLPSPYTKNISADLFQ